MEFTQGIRIMIRYFVILMVVFIAGCASSPSKPLPTGDSVAHEFRENVVKITAVWKDGSDQNGFGIITGEVAGRIYIATANHVLRDTSVSPDGIQTLEIKNNIAQKIDVQFFGQPDVKFSAELRGENDSNIDLGAIFVEDPRNIPWRKDVVSAERAERGSEVRFIGKSGKWEIPAAPGIVQGQEVPFFPVEGLKVAQGTSGAPLLTDKGLVGMVIKDSALRTTGLPIQMVEDFMKSKSIPWQLSTRKIQQKTKIPLWAQIGGGVLGAVAIGMLSAGDDGPGDGESTGTINVTAPVLVE